MRVEKKHFLSSWPRISVIWSRNFMVFQKTWTLSLFYILLEPLFILTALGYGLGAFINHVENVTYVEFFFPALICNSAMMVTYFSSTYDNFSKLTYQRTFVTQILTPIEPFEIAWGEILWAATKGTMSAAGIIFVGIFLGLVETWRFIPALGVIFLLSMFFAAMGVVIITYAKNFDQIVYPTSGIIVPMSLFSGTYFPVDQLPYGLKYISYLFPLTHAVKVVREMILKGFAWDQIGHIFVLIVFIVVFARWGSRRLSRKLLS